MTEQRLIELLRRGLDRLRRCAARLVRLFRRAVKEKAYLQRPENVKSLRHLFAEVKRVLRAVLPKKGSGWVRFGGTDPYQTGQVMQLAALFYPLYGKRIEVIPEFEEPALETKLQVSGRIYLWQLLLAGLRLMLDKNLRKMYRHFSEGEKPVGEKKEAAWEN